jgi:hypothetical protein
MSDGAPDDELARELREHERERKVQTPGVSSTTTIRPIPTIGRVEPGEDTLAVFYTDDGEQWEQTIEGIDEIASFLREMDIDPETGNYEAVVGEDIPESFDVGNSGVTTDY